MALSPVFLNLGLQYADTMNLARGILDSAKDYLDADEAFVKAKTNVALYGDFEGIIAPMERLLESKSATQAWCAAWESRGYAKPPNIPMTPAESPT